VLSSPFSAYNTDVSVRQRLKTHNPFQSKSIIKARHTPDGVPRHYATLFAHLVSLCVFSAYNLDQFLCPGVLPGLKTDNNPEDMRDGWRGGGGTQFSAMAWQHCRNKSLICVTARIHAFVSPSFLLSSAFHQLS
jgi:hypothetical protein